MAIKALTEALAALPGTLLRAAFAPAWLAGYAGALAFGALTPWLLRSYFFEHAAGAADHAPAIAASFLIGLAAATLALATLPDSSKFRWACVAAALRSSLATFAAFAGAALTGGEALRFPFAMLLAAVVSAQLAALAGFGGVCAWIAGRGAQVPRVGFAAALALSSTAILWTKAPLEAWYARSPGTGPVGAQAVLSLGPPGLLATAWNEGEMRFDFARTSMLYDEWLGNDLSWRYPELWPEREETPDGGRGLNPGVTLAFLAWGLALSALSDALGFVLARRRADAPVPVPAPGVPALQA